MVPATSEEMDHPSLPFPIFMIATSSSSSSSSNSSFQKSQRYLLYDINLITWLRRTHNILGVLIGTLPQFPQQNVFLGLPLQLQPEEVRLLVEKEIAYIVDDFEWHKVGMRALSAEQRGGFLEGLKAEGRDAAGVAERRKEVGRKKSLGRGKGRGKEKRESGRGGGKVEERSEEVTNGDEGDEEKDEEEEESLFQPPSPSPSSTTTTQPTTTLPPSTQLPPWTITPTTSTPPLPLPHPPPPSSQPLPLVNTAPYALFKHLHSKSYFLSPGLRFGCQFLVYPGDPLRFHSHFLAVGLEWEEEFDLLDLVGGGRLGTGVKKGWLVGGVEGGGEEGMREGEEEGGSEGGRDEEDRAERAESKFKGSNRTAKDSKVRTFCLEWGGM